MNEWFFYLYGVEKIQIDLLKSKINQFYQNFIVPSDSPYAMQYSLKIIKMVDETFLKFS